MRKRTRRKVYPVMSGLEIVALRNAKPNRDTTLGVLIGVRGAIEDLRLGRMTKATWDVLAHSINAAQILAVEKKIGFEHANVVAQARAAALSIGRRAAAGNMRFVAKSDELNALRDFADLHEAQIETATAGDMSDIADREAELLRSGITFSPKQRT